MCCVGNGFVINVMDYTLDISYSHDAPADLNAATGMPQQPQQTFVDPLSSFPDAGQSWSSTTCDQDLDAMSQFVLNQDFTDMDRVITFSDGSLFVTGD